MAGSALSIPHNRAIMAGCSVYRRWPVSSVFVGKALVSRALVGKALVGKVLAASMLVGGLLVGSIETALGQTVYRVIDEHGNVTFTDNPGLGGEALELSPLPGLPPALRAATDNHMNTPAVARPRGKPGQPFMPYDHFSIALPQQGSYVADGMTAVEMAIAPPLREDHTVRLLVDGAISQSALHSDVFWLTGLSSGQHELQGELLDSSQRLQHRTAVVTVTVP